MRLDVVLRYTGLVLLLNGLLLALSAAVSALYHDDALLPLLFSALLSALFGLFPMLFVPHTTDISNREGFVIVVSSWIMCCLVGAFPYILWGGEFTFTNAWFESVSGFTTTGSSILTDIESLPLGLLFWRSLTNWIGGVGIIVFVVSILPYLGIGGAILYHIDVPERTRAKLHFKSTKSVKILLAVYVGLTLLQILLLLLFGMNLFDAVTHSFATTATGGFSPKNASIAHYSSMGVEIVVIVFMVLSGMHFALLLSVALGQGRNLLNSSSTKYYLFALLLGVLLAAANLHGNRYESWAESLRFGAFQVVSLGTSTGFANADSSGWPFFTQLILIFFTLQCACAGSTSGGIKVDRIVIFGKAVGRMIKKKLYPSAIFSLRVDGQLVAEDIVEMSVLYISLYLFIVFVSSLLLTALGVDLLSAFSGASAAMGNVGPGLGTVGSTANFGHIPEAGKWILSVTMLLGRLEIYGFLVLLSPRFFKAI